MSETYVECLVKAKPSIAMKMLKGILIFLAVVAGISIFLFSYISLLLTVALGFAAYYVSLMAEIEYEYLYLDRELTVDKIMAQTKRKRVATYQIGQIEIMAPFRSYHLDNYKNRQAKVVDYSIGIEDKPDLRYVIYTEGGEKIILSPTEELVKVMKNNAPRKIFTD